MRRTIGFAIGLLLCGNAFAADQVEPKKSPCICQYYLLGETEVQGIFDWLAFQHPNVDNCYDAFPTYVQSSSDEPGYCVDGDCVNCLPSKHNPGEGKEKAKSEAAMNCCGQDIVPVAAQQKEQPPKPLFDKNRFNSMPLDSDPHIKDDNFEPEASKIVAPDLLGEPFVVKVTTNETDATEKYVEIYVFRFRHFAPPLPNSNEIRHSIVAFGFECRKPRGDAPKFLGQISQAQYRDGKEMKNTLILDDGTLKVLTRVRNSSVWLKSSVKK